MLTDSIDDVDDGSDASSHRRSQLKKYSATRWLDQHDAVAVFVEFMSYVAKLLFQIETSGDAKTSLTLFLEHFGAQFLLYPS